MPKKPKAAMPASKIAAGTRNADDIAVKIEVKDRPKARKPRKAPEPFPAASNPAVNQVMAKLPEIRKARGKYLELPLKPRSCYLRADGEVVFLAPTAVESSLNVRMLLRPGESVQSQSYRTSDAAQFGFGVAPGHRLVAGPLQPPRRDKPVTAPELTLPLEPGVYASASGQMLILERNKETKPGTLDVYIDTAMDSERERKAVVGVSDGLLRMAASRYCSIRRYQPVDRYAPPAEAPEPAVIDLEVIEKVVADLRAGRQFSAIKEGKPMSHAEVLQALATGQGADLRLIPRTLAIGGTEYEAPLQIGELKAGDSYFSLSIDCTGVEARELIYENEETDGLMIGSATAFRTRKNAEAVGRALLALLRQEAVQVGLPRELGKIEAL